MNIITITQNTNDRLTKMVNVSCLLFDMSFVFVSIFWQFVAGRWG